MMRFVFRDAILWRGLERDTEDSDDEAEIPDNFHQDLPEIPPIEDHYNHS